MGGGWAVKDNSKETCTWRVHATFPEMRSQHELDAQWYSSMVCMYVIRIAYGSLPLKVTFSRQTTSQIADKYVLAMLSTLGTNGNIRVYFDCTNDI
eukprot:5880122-Amphidinium_carterae.4